MSEHSSLPSQPTDLHAGLATTGWPLITFSSKIMFEPGQPAKRGLMPATITLLPGQREVLAQALADAVYYRDPPVHCPACDARDELCEQCAATLARASAYLDLGRELGLEPAT